MSAYISWARIVGCWGESICPPVCLGNNTDSRKKKEDVLHRMVTKKVINTKYYEKFADFREAIKNFFDNIDIYAEEISKFIGTKFHLFAT